MEAIISTLDTVSVWSIHEIVFSPYLSLLTRHVVSHPESAKPFHLYKATLELDGSLDTTNIDFLNDTEIFVGYDNRKNTFNRLISPSLPRVLSPSILESHVRTSNGNKALSLISLSDYLKAVAQRTTMFKQVGISVERPPTPEEVDVSQPLVGMRRPGDNKSLLVCQVGHPESAQPLHSYKAALEPDGSLDTAKIDFVNGGDVFVGYDNRTKAFARLISPSLPPIIPSSVLDSHVRSSNGNKALSLISLQDYSKAVEQRTTMLAQAGTAATRAESSEPNRISSRSTIQPPHEVLRPEEDDIAPRRVYQLPRRLRSGPERNHSESSDIVVLVREQRDFDDTRAIIKNWEVNLEYDFSLDTSKIFPKNPSNPYYVRGSNGEYYPLNINDDPIVDPSYLEYYLQEISGIAMPVLQIMRYSDYSRIRPNTR